MFLRYPYSVFRAVFFLGITLYAKRKGAIEERKIASIVTFLLLCSPPSPTIMVP